MPVIGSTLSQVPPGGCAEAAAALEGYRGNAGTGRSGQAAAAQQAYQELMGAGLRAEGAVASMIRRLAGEFQELSHRLSGMVMADPNQVIADINADMAHLRRLCEAG